MSRSLNIAISVLFAIWLGAIAIQLFFVAGLASIPWLIGAIVAQVAVFLIVSAILITSNTRRPYGIDPNRPPAPRDPFAMTSEDLRNAVMLADQLPYGRRKQDDTHVVERLSAILEEEADRRKPGETPARVIDVNRAHERASDMFPDPPKEES